MRTILLSAVLLLPTQEAMAQSGPINPFEVTCGDLLSLNDQNPGIAAMMLNWMVGYFYGRFSDVEGSNVTPDNFGAAVTDMGNAVRQICPNIPDMTMADFTRNLASDFANKLAQQQ